MNDIITFVNEYCKKKFDFSGILNVLNILKHESGSDLLKYRSGSDNFLHADPTKISGRIKIRNPGWHKYILPVLGGLLEIICEGGT